MSEISGYTIKAYYTDPQGQEPASQISLGSGSIDMQRMDFYFGGNETTPSILIENVPTYIEEGVVMGDNGQSIGMERYADGVLARVHSIAANEYSKRGYFTTAEYAAKRSELFALVDSTMHSSPQKSTATIS